MLRKDGTISKGSLKLGPEHREAARRVRKAASREHAQGVAPVLADLRARGVTSLRGIARELEERGVLTASGRDTLEPDAGLPRDRSGSRRGDDDRRTRERCREPTPVTPHYAPFPTYKAAGVLGLP